MDNLELKSSTPKKDSKEVLIERDGVIYYYIKCTEESDHHLNFEVEEVISWTVEKDSKPIDTELFLRAYVKASGCSHFWFGEEGRGGYMHLCGKGCYDSLKEVMDKCWEYAEKNMKNFKPV